MNYCLNRSISRSWCFLLSSHWRQCPRRGCWMINGDKDQVINKSRILRRPRIFYFSRFFNIFSFTLENLPICGKSLTSDLQINYLKDWLIKSLYICFAENFSFTKIFSIRWIRLKNFSISSIQLNIFSNFQSVCSNTKNLSKADEKSYWCKLLTCWGCRFCGGAPPRRRLSVTR